MGRKWESPKTGPSIESIEAHLASGNLAAAAVAARMLNAADPSDENADVYKRVLVAQIQSAIDRRREDDFEADLRIAEKLTDSAAWRFQRATLIAKWGDYKRAIELAGDAHSPVLLPHAADAAIRIKSLAKLPAEHHDAVRTVLKAFAAYARGSDDAARETLHAIGLQSPLLEWKLLLRGLIAFTAKDDARALENWQRLDESRLPARLAAPLRARLLPAYRDALPPKAARLATQHIEKLCGSAAAASVRDVQKLTAGAQKLHKNWDQIQRAAKLLEGEPDLAARFADGVYLAILRAGQPEDLKSYSRVFGPPPEDPDFYRLQATVLEHSDQFEMAATFWERYEQWLASRPGAWREADLPRARALVMEHLGQLSDVVHAHVDEMDDLRRAFEAMVRGRKPPVKPAKDYFEQALRLDPTALSPRLSYLHHLERGTDSAAIVSLAREALALEPGNAEALDALATGLHRSRQYSEAFEVRLQALAANPLDARLARTACRALFASVRGSLAAGDADAAAALMARHADLCVERLPFDAIMLNVTVMKKLGRTKDAEALTGRLLQAPRFRLAVPFIFSVDAALAKLKPAQKTAANKLFAEAMAACASLPEVLQFYDGVRNYERDGFEYRGQKTMMKKIEALIERTLDSEFNDVDCDRLMRVLSTIDRTKFTLKICEHLLPRFSKSPRLLFVLAKALVQGRATRKIMQRVQVLLFRAKNVAADSDEPAMQELLSDIEAAIRGANADSDPLDFFDAFRR